MFSEIIVHEYFLRGQPQTHRRFRPRTLVGRRPPRVAIAWKITHGVAMGLPGTPHGLP